jgi:hypothetical protein
MPRREAGEVDAGRTPHNTASAIGSDDVTSRNSERCFSAPSFDRNAGRMLLHDFDQMVAPDIHAQFRRALFNKLFSGRLRQEQGEGKRDSSTEKSSSVSNPPKCMPGMGRPSDRKRSASPRKANVSRVRP